MHAPVSLAAARQGAVSGQLASGGGAARRVTAERLSRSIRPVPPPRRDGDFVDGRVNAGQRSSSSSPEPDSGRGCAFDSKAWTAGLGR